MANDLTGTTWVLDTTGVITTDVVRIRRMRWRGGTTAGHLVTVQDAATKAIWQGNATGANYTDETMWPGGRNFNGLKLATLQSGILEVELA